MIKECRHNLTACLENFYLGPRTGTESRVPSCDLEDTEDLRLKTRDLRLGRIGLVEATDGGGKTKDNNNSGAAAFFCRVQKKERQRDGDRGITRNPNRTREIESEMESETGFLTQELGSRFFGCSLI